MSIDIVGMRQKIQDAYSSDSWKQKVKRMPNDQIIAIYYKFKRAGKIKDPD